MTFSISARLSSWAAVEGWYKGWYGKGHLLIFLSYTSDKLFYETNKQNEIIKWLYMEVSLCIQQMHFQNTVKQEHLYPQSMLMTTFSMKQVET
jgi:hypothetical protein